MITQETFTLKKMIKELESIKGRHTELVSVFVSAGSNLQDSIDQVKNEQSTANNIKSKANRKNVVDALEKIIQHLRTFRKTPKNGLVVFSGNVSENEGKTNIKLWSMEPPIELKKKVYWCDQVFILDPLYEMVKEKEIYGLIVMDSKEADIGFLTGKRIESVLHFDSAVPGKTTKGGYSQMRYQHVREALLNDFMKKIGENASKIFMKEKNLKGVIVGGPGPNKEIFMKGEHLTDMVKRKVLGIKDVSYTGEYGLEELVNRSEDLLKEASLLHEKELLEKFFENLRKDGNVVYGLENTKKVLEIGAVDSLLISENFELWHATLRCQTGHDKITDLIEFDLDKQKCEICNTNMNLIDKKEVVEIITEKTLEFGGVVELISVDTRQGKQFEKIGGVGALLRYKV